GSLLDGTAPTWIDTLSLHDALPILRGWPLEQAGMLGTAWARAPSSASHVRRHVMERAFTAAGKPALTTLFSGRSTSMQRYVPERSEEHTSELQSRENLVCRLLLEKK